MDAVRLREDAFNFKIKIGGIAEIWQDIQVQYVDFVAGKGKSSF